MCHRAGGVNPRLTSRGSAPAGALCEAKGGILPDRFVRLCVTAVRCWGEARGVPKGDLTMPREKDLKRLVRARMKKTGEAYTAARAQLLRKQTPDAPPRAAELPAPVAALSM